MALVNAETGEIVTDMTPEQARALTDQIKGAAEELWSLLLDAHNHRAWAALGYATWRDYATAEFGMSQSRAYQLLDAARVVREIEAASSTSVELSEAVTRDLKPHLEIVTDKVREAVEEVPADDPERAEVVGRIVRDVVTQERARIVKEREDREALQDFRDEFTPTDYDAAADEASMLARAATRRAVAILADLPDPSSLAETWPDYDADGLSRADMAVKNLTELVTVWEARR